MTYMLTGLGENVLMSVTCFEMQQKHKRTERWREG